LGIKKRCEKKKKEEEGKLESKKEEGKLSQTNDSTAALNLNESRLSGVKLAVANRAKVVVHDKRQTNENKLKKPNSDEMPLEKDRKKGNLGRRDVSVKPESESQVSVKQVFKKREDRQLK